MHGGESNAKERQRWWLRMRRSFQQPDLLSDSAARTRIADRLLQQFPMGYLGTRDDAVALVGTWVDAVVDGYSDGSLEDIVARAVDGKEYRLDETGPLHAIALDSFSDRPQSEETRRFACKIVEELNDAVARSLLSQPFESESGVYFSIPVADDAPGAAEGR